MKSKQQVGKQLAEQLTKDPEYIKIVDRIDAEVDFVDLKPYSHNIINISLQQAAKKYGNAVANDLIEEFNLEDLGWSKQPLEDDIEWKIAES